MRRVAVTVPVGRSAGAYTKAVGVRSRSEWCRHTISRKELVGITGRLVHTDGPEEVLVVGDEVWGEWTSQVVEGTNWRNMEEGGEGRVGSKGKGSHTGELAQKRG